MIWFYLALLAALALAPLGWSVWRGGRLRGRRDAALALHRAQLAELDRDLAENRILPAEHAAARLEVQRRLLAEADTDEAGTSQSSPLALVITAALVPALAVILYVADGMPDYAARRIAAEDALKNSDQAKQQAADLEIIGKLRGVLATMDPHSERARNGFVLLGNAELTLGNLPDAADAFRKALDTRFEPTLGAETAEIITEIAGKVTPEAAGLFKRALAEAPANVPWRKDAAKRLAEAGGS
jgi:cytochrome c-type biogenesis protein CcmH